MAELLPTGLEIRRYPTIREEIAAAIQQNSSAELLFEEDTILGQLVSILSQEQSVVEQTLQYLYSALDRDKAEGTSLDSLLYLVGLERLGEGYSATDTTLFTAPNNETISTGFITENPSTKDRFLTTNTKLLSVESCYNATYEVTSNPISTNVVLTIDSIDYTYITPATPTVLDTLTGLSDAINIDALSTAIAEVLTVDVDADEYLLLVTSKDTEKEIELSALDYIEPVEVSAFIPVQAEVGGPIRAPAGTITGLVTPSAATAVTNLEEVGVGRNRETDEEYRIRASKSLAVSGSATYAAVLAALLNLPDISTVLIEENETNTTNALGLPPHSFEAIVQAPDTDEVNQSIAETLWNEKPIGIQTYGNTSVDYVDTTGATRVINFSRPASVITATRVTYTLYDEEVPTEGLEAVIRNTVVEYGNSLTSGTDIIPKRFYQSIYANTTGLDDVTVEMQVLAASGDVPNPANWSEDRIPVLPSEVSSFNPDDVYFVGP